MKITLTNAGKRFNRDWIFRHVNYEFVTGHAYAITGPNGSGKSTLLQAIAGAIGLSEGGIGYSVVDDLWSMAEVTTLLADGKAKPTLIAPNDHRPSAIDQRSTETIYKFLSIAAPYLELIEEMTLTEFLAFHGKFKPFLQSVSMDAMVEAVGLSDAAHKQIRYFSSGMKQRVKLLQAIFSDTPVLLLDEPCTNLDEDGILLYHGLMKSHAMEKLVIVSSNEKQEYAFCDQVLDMKKYK